MLSGEYRTLSASYADIKEVVRSFRQAPVEVRVQTSDGADGWRRNHWTNGAGVRRRRRGRRRPPSAAAPSPAARSTGPSFVATLDEMVEHFLALGRKGVAVNRYKGLGEMNPDTLWATTMNPDTRTLLQVKAEDHTEADQMFTTLMGDQVEPRRKFIEDNALDVRNLDI